MNIYINGNKINIFCRDFEILPVFLRIEDLKKHWSDISLVQTEQKQLIR